MNFFYMLCVNGHCSEQEGWSIIVEKILEVSVFLLPLMVFIKSLTVLNSWLKEDKKNKDLRKKYFREFIKKVIIAILLFIILFIIYAVFYWAYDYNSPRNECWC